MNSTIFRTLKLLSALVLLTFSVACNNEDAPQMPTEGMKVQFTLASLSPASRAGTWGDSYSSVAATNPECLIDASKIYGYLFLDGTLLGSLKNVTKSGSVYTAEVNTSALTTVAKGKRITMHVFANVSAPTDSYTATTAALKSNAATFTPVTAIYEKESSAPKLPMWGVATCLPAYTVGTMGFLDANFGTIKMIRPVAKVEVIVNNASDPNDVLDNVKVSGLIDTQYFSVPSYASESIIATTTLSRYHTDLSTPVSSPTKKEYTFAASLQRASFYIPEQLNRTGDDEIKIFITVNGDTYETPILFRDYKNGAATNTPKNIMRNHCYTFTVTIDKGKLSVTSTEWEDTIINIFEF